MQKRKRFTKIFTLFVVTLFVFAVSSMTYAYIYSSFTYTSNYPGYKGYTDWYYKENNSAGSVYYGSGSTSVMYAQMWAISPDEDEGKWDYAGYYTNFTTPHLDTSGNTVDYYECRKNQYALVPNTVYQAYGTWAPTKMAIFIYGTGNVTGKWAWQTAN